MAGRVKFIFIATLLTAALTLLSSRIFGNEFFWLGLIFSLTVFQFYFFVYIPSAKIIEEIPEERIFFNLSLAQKKPAKLFWPFQWVSLVLVATLLGLFVYVEKNEIQKMFNQVSTLIKSEEPFLRIEFPSFTEKQPLIVSFNNENEKLRANTGCYFEVGVENKKEIWKVLLEGKKMDGTSGKPVEATLGDTMKWGRALKEVIQSMGLPSSENIELTVKLIRGEKTLTRTLLVEPLNAPQVSLEAKRADFESGNLLFAVGVSSSVPLSQVELNVRTKSGYRSVKTLAEFANISELQFNNDAVELSTLGIAFAPEDVLYVKAVAKTVALNLVGESEELSFEVKSPIQVRQELIKKIEETLREFKGGKESKNRILDKLEEARAVAEQLGRKNPVIKDLANAHEHASEMKLPQDSEGRQAKEKLQSALEFLKRQQSKEQQANLIERIQNLKSSVARDSLAESLSQDAKALSEETKKVKSAILGMKDNLTAEEQKLMRELIQRDRTEQHLEDTAKELDGKKKNEAEIASSKALEEAQKNLGGAMQILNNAKRRAIKEARERLTKADKNLDDAGKKENNSQAQKEAKDAEQELQRAPKINDEFQKAVDDAKKQSRGAQEKFGQSQQRAAESHLESAQDAIVRALNALQEEEQREKQSGKEQEDRNFRSQLDAMSAQGQLDMSWRKKVIDEIARLKASGENSDSPLIRYLESRLR